MMRRPSEKRPVGWWKKVSPYGGNAASGRSLGVERPIKFPVSAIESPKLMIDSKFRHCVSELTVVTKIVDKKKLTSFINIWESWDAMREVRSDFLSFFFFAMILIIFFVLKKLCRPKCFALSQTAKEKKKKKQKVIWQLAGMGRDDHDSWAFLVVL